MSDLIARLRGYGGAFEGRHGTSEYAICVYEAAAELERQAAQIIELEALVREKMRAMEADADEQERQAAEIARLKSNTVLVRQQSEIERLQAENKQLLEALRLLFDEMVLSGNAGSKDYGWPKAITAAREALKDKA
jgi:hypothetical protein